ncbi:hypothetical protein EJ997_02715 [Flaviflexus ciconiae]|uniref:Uncharacterized protein n=1 Tax=Flaviflexus ciconiae TaxID=2496867 RepID=A0A3Q9G0W0_9ACTO|nr:hypothetical protein EJ997_02715 [Flaviflexus ciconiae]
MSVPIPVANLDLVTIATVLELVVGNATRDLVLHKEGVPPADSKGVDTVAIPVANEHVVIGAAVLEGDVGIAGRQGVA